MANALKDKYTNIFQFTAEESAINTLTFGEIQLGLTIFQKVALLINRVTVDWGAACIAQLAAATDTCAVGIVQDDSVASISLEQPATVFKRQKVLASYGVAANSIMHDVVEVIDYSTLPGGGELITPSPLYWAIQSVGTAATFPVTVRVCFQVVELKSDEYFELLEARRFY